MRRSVVLFVAVLMLVLVGAQPAFATSQAKVYTLPSGYGTLTSNCWRQTGGGSPSGNQLLWDYQVSAVYGGTRTVERIRTTWWAGATLKNSASISLGVSTGGVSFGYGSSWVHVNTPSKYWENTNGSKTSSWRSNLIVGPSIYYMANTITTSNTGMVKIKGDARLFQITAGV